MTESRRTLREGPQTALPSPAPGEPKRILVTGATGYIGGRLVPRLLDEGYSVRVLVRDPRRVRLDQYAEPIEVVVGDLTSAETLVGALDGVHAAYYLVHTMTAGDGFAERDRLAARNFTAAAADVAKVIYLGGLFPSGSASEHLASRAEVGRILASALPVTELRAGPIIGSGLGSSLVGSGGLSLTLSSGPLSFSLGSGTEPVMSGLALP